MKNHMRLIAICCVIAALFVTHAEAQLRVGTYNVLNNPDNATEDNSMRQVFDGIAQQSVNGIAKPLDILALQETDNAGLSRIPRLLGEVNPDGDYRVINTASVGGDRNAIVYDQNTVQLLDTLIIPTAGPRDTLRARFRPVGYTSPDAEFFVYASHLRASQGNSRERESEVKTIRNNADALGPDASIMYLGDFNFYSTGELGYRAITRSGNGRAFDPPLSLGNKVPGSSDVTFPSSGRRFDYQFITDDLFDDEGIDIIDDSYRVFYGSGDSISDHRPIVADYQLPAIMEAELEQSESTYLQGQSARIMLSVQNIANVVTSDGADKLIFNVTSTGDVYGDFDDSISIADGLAQYEFQLDTLTAGLKQGTVVVNASSDGVENSFYSFDVTYRVVPEPGSLAALSSLIAVLLRRNSHVSARR